MHACVCLYEGVARRCRCSEWGGTCAEDPIRGEDGWKCHSKAAEVNTERGERAPKCFFITRRLSRAQTLLREVRHGHGADNNGRSRPTRAAHAWLAALFLNRRPKADMTLFFFSSFFFAIGKPFPGVFRTCLSNAFTKFNFHGANHLELILACFEGAALSLSLSALH